MIRPLLALFAVLAPTAVSAQSSQPCGVTETYLSVPPPAIVNADLVIRTETVAIAAPLDTVIDIVATLELEDSLTGSGDLPGVERTEPLVGDEFGAPGTRRLVCLTDNSTVLEEALIRDRDETSYRFRYVVWNYTSPQAGAIAYGVGDFLFTAAPDGGTHAEWSYGFKLKPDAFPGNLGPLGRFLFRVSFLDRTYAEMMRTTLDVYRQHAEPAPST